MGFRSNVVDPDLRRIVFGAQKQEIPCLRQ